MERDFLWMNELREFFGVNRAGIFVKARYATIKKMFKDGLKYSYIGNRIVVFKKDLEEYLARKREERSKGYK